MIKQIIALSCFIMSLPAIAAGSGGITSLDIATATLKGLHNQSGCLKYRVEAKVCVWIADNGDIITTPFVEHNVPDLVVSVYRNEDENPWKEGSVIYDKIPGLVRQKAIPNIGSGDASLNINNDNSLVFKEADVIGNPGISLFMQNIPMVSLRSNVTAMLPYYSSILDTAEWRGLTQFSKLEEEYASKDIRYIGSGLNSWGSLYPHQGYVAANDDAIASMVIAQRAVDLLSNKISFTHLRNSISDSCGEHCKAMPIKENSDDTLFQRIYPDIDDECVKLGSNDSYNIKMLTHDEKYDGSYMWVVWRRYEGCVQTNGKLLAVT